MNKTWMPVVLSCAVIACSPKDDVPLPSPHAKVGDILAMVSFSDTPNCNHAFHSRLFIADEKGKQSELLNGVSFFTLRGSVASSLQGARTAAVVRSGSFTVGQWVTPVMKSPRGAAMAQYVDAFIVDLADTSRRCVFHASSRPGASSRQGTTTVNGRSFESNGTYSDGLLLGELIDEILKPPSRRAPARGD